MKKLKDILDTLPIESVFGTVDLPIDTITFDSSQVGKNTLFVAIKGAQKDGHTFIEQAISLGAIAILCQEVPKSLKQGVTYICVKDTTLALALVANNFYNKPSTKLNLVGITGTNGKTTTATLLYALFTELGYKVGLLSTVKIKVADQEFVATHTTPDPLTINYYLNKMVEAGCQYCFMEVSSHGIVQNRTCALEFKAGIFTNISHDHLDYHKTFACYRDVKKVFFDTLPKTAFVLTNSDDKNGLVMTQNTKAKVKTYSLKRVTDYKAQIIESTFLGMLLKINQKEIWVQLIGEFNAYNLLTVYATALEMGVLEQDTLLAMSKLKSVEGRFQYYVAANKVIVIVDYAHTPDALQKVIDTINSIKKDTQKLIAILGCGGDRDKAKRPIMAKIASEYSDKVIFTSDNPRFEDSYQILKEMEAGVEEKNTMKTVVIENRRQAIKAGSQQAKSGDIILIAGKGHETYQEIKGVRSPFSDLETAQEFLEKLN